MNDEISIAMVQPQVTAFGLERLGIWFQGCTRSCVGCQTPEFQEFKRGMVLKKFLDFIRNVVRKNNIKNVVISGGEPLLQAESLYKLLFCLRSEMNSLEVNDPDILLYSGYRFEEIVAMPLGKDIVGLVDVLVDGEYIAALNDGMPLRGSSNQRIIFLNNEHKALYEPILSGLRRQEVMFNKERGFVSVGLSK